MGLSLGDRLSLHWLGRDREDMFPNGKKKANYRPGRKEDVILSAGIFASALHVARATLVRATGPPRQEGLGASPGKKHELLP